MEHQEGGSEAVSVEALDGVQVSIEEVNEYRAVVT